MHVSGRHDLFYNFSSDVINVENKEKESVFSTRFSSDFQATASDALRLQNELFISSPLSGKNTITFCNISDIFTSKKCEVTSQKEQSKFDKYYFIHRIPRQLPVKKFGLTTFQYCDHRSQRTFQKNFNPNFQIWLVFLVPFLHYLKT